MEDLCAVCAEPLHWVGIGRCGHREVCSECTARLRFVMNDYKCCICKQESASVYVTKALGDDTRTFQEFECLKDRSNGDAGKDTFWYDRDVKAYFDDKEHFVHIRALCTLTCVICLSATEKKEKEVGSSGPGQGPSEGGGKTSAPSTGECRPSPVEPRRRFGDIDTLKRHLLVDHKLMFCEICLEGRKVFFCEQRLYKRAQLERHCVKGDTEVDGTAEQRGGFKGHPLCVFCQKRFYGENEQYSHMTTEHFHCHLCQRARPGVYEHYRDYTDLEVHYRRDHLLCEHPECLEKKFIVFATEEDLKVHNATCHGGKMSRAQRNSALTIPVSFVYRRPGQSGDEDGRGRGGARRGGYRGAGPSQQQYQSQSDPRASSNLQTVLRNSVVTAQIEDATRESLAFHESMEMTSQSSSSASSVSNSFPVPGNSSSSTEGNQLVPVLDPSASALPSSGSSRWLAVVGTSGGSSMLRESAFPPLPGAPKSNKSSGGASSSHQGASMAQILAGGGHGRKHAAGIKVLVKGGGSHTQGRGRSIPGDGSGSSWATAGSQRGTSDGSGSGWATAGSQRGTRDGSGSGWATAGSQGGTSDGSGSSWIMAGSQKGACSSTGGLATTTGRGQGQYLGSGTGPGPPPEGTRRVPAGGGGEKHRGGLVEGGGPDIDRHDQPSGQSQLLSEGGVSSLIRDMEGLHSMEDIRAANKALVERIRSGLNDDQVQFADFKGCSARYKRGEMSSQVYYEHIWRLGLAHLVVDLARLCPDGKKGQELLAAHDTAIASGSVSLPSSALADSFAAGPVNTQSVQGVFCDDTDISLGQDQYRRSNRGSRENALSGSALRGKGKVESDEEDSWGLSGNGVASSASASRGVSIGRYGGGRMKALQTSEVTNSKLSLDEEKAGPRDGYRSISPSLGGNLYPERSVPGGSGEGAQTRGESVEHVGLSDGWACMLCTLQNGPEAVRCEACGSERDSKGRRRKAGKGVKINLTGGDGSAISWANGDQGPAWGNGIANGIGTSSGVVNKKAVGGSGEGGVSVGGIRWGNGLANGVGDGGLMSNGGITIRGKVGGGERKTAWGSGQ